MLFREKVGRILVQKEKAVASGRYQLPEACPGENPPTQRQVAPQETLYCLSRRYARGILPLFAQRPSRHRVRVSSERDRESTMRFPIWPVMCRMAGKTYLPGRPASLRGCRRSRFRRGTSRILSEGKLSRGSVFFACVSHAEKSQSNLLSCSGVQPCPAVFFLSCRGRRFRPPGVSFF